jgi:hypothetical protein
MTAFFDIENSRKKPTDFDFGIAERLRKVVGTRGNKDWNSHTWACYIYDLRNIDQASEETIKRVLDWYAGVIGNKYIPKAYSARSFRSKFDALYRAYQKDDTRKVILSPEGEQVWLQLRNLNWGGKDEAVRLSISNSLTFLAEWKKYLWRKAEDTKEGNLARFLHSKMSGHTFLIQWYESVNNKINYYKSFDGDFTKFDIGIEHSKFVALMLSFSFDYGTSKNTFFGLAANFPKSL